MEHSFSLFHHVGHSYVSNGKYYKYFLNFSNSKTTRISKSRQTFSRHSTNQRCDSDIKKTKWRMQNQMQDSVGILYSEIPKSHIIQKIMIMLQKI